MNLISGGKGPRALAHLLLAGAFSLSLAGCNTDKLVQVTDPSRLLPGATATIGAIPALVNGSVRQFTGGYSGLGDDAFVSMGVMTDEFAWGDTFTTRNAADKRITQPPQLGNLSDAAFGRLHQSRELAQRALALIDKFDAALVAQGSDPDGDRSLLRAIEGYDYITLSEGWCSSVPFSTVPPTGDIDPKAIVFGPPLTTSQMNTAAVALFDSALTSNPNNQLAMVGKGRALLNLGLFTQAAAAVGGVGTTFVFQVEHSVNTSAENNAISSLIDNGRYAIANLEGGTTATGAALRPDNNTATSNATAEGLPFRALNDPRVPYVTKVTNGGRCFSSAIFCWTLDNYPTFDAKLPVASGVEARLIEAEASFNNGDIVSMLATLNSLRAQVASLLPLLYPQQRQVFPLPTTGAPTLAPLIDPGTPDAQRAMLFQERALWLFATGHRLGDLRRLVRNYAQPASSVFPSGPYFRGGGSFGTDVSYPVPFNEENNLQFVRAACVTSSAGT